MVGIGVDVVSKTRFDRFAGDHAERLSDLFTSSERARSSEGALAAAWALKEATLKSIGTLGGWEQDWTEIEATSLEDPAVGLTGKAEAAARDQNIAGFFASLTETDDYFLATTVAFASPTTTA